MSSIDERVVEMSFDNKQFEKGVETTIASINELKQSLKFDQTGKGLDALSDSFRNIDTNSFSNALDAINDKFSIFGTFKDQVLRDLVGYVEGKVVGVFTQLKDAMTIDSQVWSGFSEYETKMNAIQVLKGSVIGTGDVGIEITPEVDQAAYDIIYNGLYGIGAERKAAVEAMGLDYAVVQSRVDEIVANNWEWVKSANGVAYTMDDINNTLDTMNEYADKTIYNFPQMTENLGKFTVAAIDLKQAEKSIIGLANLAASAGADATQMSQATYQMSQAMSSGIIRLMDWNSLAQRSMDTAQLKQVILEVAKQQGVASDILNKASTNFRDSLSENWLTTDIFNEALAVYADEETARKYGFEGVYQMAMEAAQRIRTITMLKDTLTEQIQSGWTESWQYVIGDSEEAADVLTRVNDALSSLIQPTIDNRNEMLKYWKLFGGREYMIDAISNAFQAFVKVLNTVKSAWNEIFDGDSTVTLLVISRRLSEFTQKLIMSDETADKVKRTFKGLFAIFDIAINIVKSLFRALTPVFDLFKKNEGQKGLLDYTASLGDFLVALHDGAIESDIFYNIFSSVVNFLISIPAKIKTAINKLEEYLGVDFSAIFETAYEGVKSFVGGVAEAIRGFDGIDTSSVGNFASGVKDKLSPLSKIGAFLSGLFDILKALWSKIKPIFSAIGNFFYEGFMGIKDNILGGIEGIDSDKIIDIFLGGSLVALIMQVKSFFEKLTSSTKGIKDVLDGVVGVLDGVKDALAAWSLDIKANALIKIAVAVAILAASLWALSKIDKTRLDDSLASLTITFIELIGTLKALGSSTSGVIVASSALLIISGAILMLVGAMALISFMNPESIAKGIGTISAFLFGLSKAIQTINKSGAASVGTALSIMFMADAIIVLVGAIALIGLMKTETVVKGIIAIAAMMFVLTKAIQGLGKAGKVSIAVAPAIIGLTISLAGLAGVVYLFGKMNLETLVKGGVSVIAMLLTMVGAISLLSRVGKPKTILALGLSLIPVASALVIMAGAIALLSTVEFGSAMGSVLAFSILILTLAAASKIVEKSIGSVVAMSVGVLILSQAMIAMALALKVLTGEDTGELFKIAGILSGVILVLAVSLKSIAKSGPSGAASIVLIAGAIYVLTIALKEMEKLDTAKLGESLKALGFILAGVMVLGLVMTKAGEGFIQFSAGVAILAGSVLLIAGAMYLMAEPIKSISEIPWKNLQKVGSALAYLLVIMSVGGIIADKLTVGFLAFSGSVAIFAAGIYLLASSFNVFADALIKLSSADFTNLGANIAAVCEAIIADAPLIGEAVYQVISTIVSYAGELLHLFLFAIVDAMEDLDDSIERVTLALLNIIIVILAGIEEASYEIGSHVIGILIGLIDGVAERTPELMSSLVNLVVQIIDGLATALSEQSEALSDAIINLIISVLEVTALLLSKLLQFGKDLLSGIWDGITEKWESVKLWFQNIPSYITSALSTVWDKIKGVGTYIIDGFKEGLSNAWDAIETWVDDHFGWLVDGIEKLLGINSPSKVMEEIGDYTMQGFNEGLEEGGEDTLKDVDNITNDVIDGFEDGLDNQLAFGDLLGDAEITPVLNMDQFNSDLSGANTTLDDINAQMNFSMNDQLSQQFGSMIDSMNDLGEYNNNLNTMMDTQFGDMNSNLENLNNNNAAMSSDISILKEIVGGLSSKMDNMSVTLDSTALVGGLSSGMNDALGKQTNYTSRGMTSTNISYNSALKSAHSQEAYAWAGVKGYVPNTFE